MQRVGTGIATIVGSVGLYFLLAGEVSWSEAIACAIVLAVTGPFAVALVRVETVPMRVSWRGWFAILSACRSLVPELWSVGRGLSRAVLRRPEGMQGVVRRVPFRFGALDEDDIGRRAAVVTALSLAPNGFAVEMDHEADELLLHQLVDTPVGGDREWPA